MVDREPENQELDAILPLVITNGSRIADVVLMNQKGYRKSIETGRLWTIHPKRGRLLPYEPKTSQASAGFDRLSKGPRWYQAEVAESQTPQAQAAEKMSGRRSDLDELKAYEQPRPGLEIVTLLEAVIKERREAMPEGSYTTHLFESGLDKIRKKTGEEAVELILAEDKEEIAHEAADLIYHLLVLLEAAGVPLQAVLEELQNRSS